MNYKKDFPIFEQLVNGKKLIYLDSAATSQKPQIVIDSISEYYKKTNANVKRGIYPLAEKSTEMLDYTREKVRRFINASSKDQIVFTRNTTESLNLLTYSMSHNISSLDSIATSVLEHHSNFVPWQMLAARLGSPFEVFDISDSFEIQFGNLKKTKILAITHVSNVLGNILEIEKIIKFVRKNNPDVVIVVDAAQSSPHIQIDVQKLDCDFLVFSGHKMFAGMGVGVLYGKKKRLEELDPFLFGGQMIKEVSIKKTTFRESPDKFEAGTMSIADIVSMGVAIDYIEDIGLRQIEEYELSLTTFALERLSKVDGLQIIGPKKGRNRIGVISFTIDGIHPHDIAQVLGDEGICVRAGHHCAMPLHKRLGIPSTVRASLHIYNDEKDIVELVKGIKKAQSIFKSK